MGSRVRVQVSRVDLDGRRIDFRLISESEGISVKPGKENPLSGLALCRTDLTKVGLTSGANAHSD